MTKVSILKAISCFSSFPINELKQLAEPKCTYAQLQFAGSYLLERHYRLVYESLWNSNSDVFPTGRS